MANILPFRGISPRTATGVYIADTAVVIGDVEIGRDASIWFGVIIRGDVAPIRIGARTNVQDGAIIHCDEDAPTSIGEDVVIGHGAIVHGATVGDGAQISIGAIVLSHAIVESGAIVAAGALVPEGATVASNTVVMGTPAKPRRYVSDNDRRAMNHTVDHYVQSGREYSQHTIAAPEHTDLPRD